MFPLESNALILSIQDLSHNGLTKHNLHGQKIRLLGQLANLHPIEHSSNGIRLSSLIIYPFRNET